MQDRTMIYPCTPDYGTRFVSVFEKLNTPAPDYRWVKPLALIAGIVIAISITGG